MALSEECRQKAGTDFEEMCADYFFLKERVRRSIENPQPAVGSAAAKQVLLEHFAQVQDRN